MWHSQPTSQWGESGLQLIKQSAASTFFMGNITNAASKKTAAKGASLT
ncbi:hypothetical protein MtrunA17_Chr3g0104581 [Medicago truncatula]|uniref:Uncharacterized protein n=1 Tax=Medicago truncatula TaxID=3880 RepID=A0A396ITB4_MEDTR|nr:hypothetical protein MtrunA17_Chr3g0104581 [Medicago truncatula]